MCKHVFYNEAWIDTEHGRIKPVNNTGDRPEDYTTFVFFGIQFVYYCTVAIPYNSSQVPPCYMHANYGDWQEFDGKCNHPMAIFVS